MINVFEIGKNQNKLKLLYLSIFGLEFKKFITPSKSTAKNKNQ